MATHKQYMFAIAVWQGESYADAARIAGYSGRTEPSKIATQARRAGLLPDPDLLTRDVATARIEAHAKMVRTFVDGLDEVNEALLEAAESGNVQAMREVYDRVFGKPVQPTDITSGGEPIGDHAERADRILAILGFVESRGD